VSSISFWLLGQERAVDMLGHELYNFLGIPNSRETNLGDLAALGPSDDSPNTEYAFENALFGSHPTDIFVGNVSFPTTERKYSRDGSDVMRRDFMPTIFQKKKGAQTEE